LQGTPLLQTLEFNEFHFAEEHCRALATLQRRDLEVILGSCILDPQDAEDDFIEWFRHNQVVTELTNCEMESSIYCAFSGNNSVKELLIGYYEEQTRSMFRALPGNMGIEHLTVLYVVTTATWRLLFRSLSTHPRIKLLSLSNMVLVSYGSSSAESRSTVMDAMLQMLRRNTVVQTIELPRAFNDEEEYQNLILPRLEMNRSCFEVQRRAVKRADPSIRPQLLGRALHMVRYNPELVFIFLSENIPAFVRTEEEEDGDREEEYVAPLENDPNVVSLSRQKRKVSSSCFTTDILDYCTLNLLLYYWCRSKFGG
jgi:hypothetical protein